MKNHKNLFTRFVSGKLTKTEEQNVSSWLDEFIHPNARTLTDQEIEQSINRFRNRIDRESLARRNRIRYATAASILIAFSFTFIAYQFWQSENLKEDAWADIPAAHGQAILSFEDGKEISISDLNEDTTFLKEGIAVLSDSLKGLQIVQTSSDVSSTAEDLVFHTVKTPFGGIVRLKLEDGSNLLINAGSEVRFPHTFKGSKERKIFVEGEVYLQVAHQPEKPFRVKSNHQLVEVLGTTFNINSYNPHQLLTTLVEGRVKVLLQTESGEQQLMLAPGEQSVGTDIGLKKQKVNLEKDLDWQKEEFVFDNSSMDEVMAKISKWYNISYVLAPSAQKVRLNGVISRKRSLKEVLHYLQQIDKIKFTFKDGRIHVA